MARKAVIFTVYTDVHQACLWFSVLTLKTQPVISLQIQFLLNCVSVFIIMADFNVEKGN